MPRLHPNTILGLLAVGFGLVLIFVWAPLDSENGIVFTRRGKYSIGDGLAPLVAGAFFVVPGLMLLVGAKSDDAPRMVPKDWRFLFSVLTLGAVALLLMRYAGPLAAAAQEGGYRPLRASFPWRFIGFLLGGAWFIGALIALVEGRVTWRAVLIGIGGALGIALFYDLPFEDLLLPPNGGRVMGALDYVWAGVLAVFQGPEAFTFLGIYVSVTVLMVIGGLFTGIIVGATPGLGQVIALAISLPILISVFGFNADALLPVLGFMIGVMKGSTVGGAVPAILFNTPGTPDSYMTTLDGYPMTQKGQANKALRVAHLSSVTGDTFSDIVLIICAPFLAILVERYLDLPEKTALIILSLSFIAVVVGKDAAKGLLACGLGLFFVFVGTGEEFYPRLTLGFQPLADGFPIVAAVVGTLVIGAIFFELEQLSRERAETGAISRVAQEAGRRLRWADIRPLVPFISRSAVIGTGIGALPGIGSTLAATLGYAAGSARHAKTKGPGEPGFGEGVPQGVAATEAANSSVSGANLIPVLSLGIPGNTAAVFLILAMESIGGFNPGPAVFKFSAELNTELVIAFGLFTTMVIANLLNWTVGGMFMRSMGVMTRVPKQYLLPVVLLLTMASLYVQETDFAVLWFALGFGTLGYLMRKLGMSPLPFVIAFVLGRQLEATARQAFAATGADPFFLLNRPIALAFILMAVVVIVISMRRRTT